MSPEANIIARRWVELGAGFNPDRRAAASELELLLDAYAASGRHYHDQRHIVALLELSDAHGKMIVDLQAVDFAILYHDAVYEPTRQDNETRSAELAREALDRLDAGQVLIDKVCRYIEATQHSALALPVGADPDLDCLLDFDLSILAAEPAAYDAYARAIRREYSIYPDASYRRGRIAVLEKLLALPGLYRSAALSVAWEAPARNNLAREIASLRAA